MAVVGTFRVTKNELFFLGKKFQRLRVIKLFKVYKSKRKNLGFEMSLRQLN